MISAYPAVRAALLERQQDFAGQEGGAVLDGRDIGTVIAPDADVKLFVTASPEVRAERRLKELEKRGMTAHYEDVLSDIRSRDARDAGGKSRRSGRRPTLCCWIRAISPDQAIADALRLVEAFVSAGRVAGRLR